MSTAPGAAPAVVSFPEQNRKSEVAVGRTLLDAANAARLEISAICAGRGVCGKCRVVILAGSEQVSALTDLERMSLSDHDIQQGFRIACCARILHPGPISVQIPPESLAQVQQLLVAGVQPEVELDPLVEKHLVTLPRSSLSDSSPDLERLTETLRRECNLQRLKAEYSALLELPEAIRDGAWKVTATIARDEEIITWIDAGDTTEQLYGFAIDVGTTKLAGYLVDLKSGTVVARASKTNPQVVFGSDVITRISYATKGKGELAELQRSVIEATNELIRECCVAASAQLREVFHVVMVGNTAMHHLFLGIPPKYVALSPYTPVMRASFQTKASQVGVTANPGCLLSCLPCVAGFVGADAVADVLATQIHESTALALLVDIGTNTEIVLGDRKRLICCSAPSGSAFEGAQIKHGMRGEVGAIERVAIDIDLRPDYSTIGGEKPRGICGSGIVDAIAGMRHAGIINLAGRISPDIRSERLRRTDGIAEYVIAWKDETQTGRDIVITQRDIEEIKLAKAAIYSGVTILAKHLQVDVKKITKLFVAGAFGTYVDPYSARGIGMYPDIPLGRISFVGNTAGSGARMVLLSRRKGVEAQKIADSLEYVELASDQEFRRAFTDALYIPHRNALET